MRNTLLALILGFVLLTQACVMTTTTRTMWSEPPPGQPNDLPGRVEWIQETVRKTEGNPGAGAAAGAVVGGLLGGMITGRGLGALVGAAGGAVIGANESQGHREDRTYDVLVRFDNGTSRIFSYRGYPPFQPGQLVSLTPRGLVMRGNIGVPPPHTEDFAPAPSQPQTESENSETKPSTPQPGDPPPPPPAVPTQPSASQSAQSLQPSAPTTGQWVFTQQYGWVWMPYGAEYTFTSDYEYGDPYMYVYYPSRGWTWVEAPWLWGCGPMPFFTITGRVNFAWYGHGWGGGWRGDRPKHYRSRFRERHGYSRRHR